MDEFYRKARKYLKLEDSKEALCKAEGAAANKKNNPGIVPDGGKEKDDTGRRQTGKESEEVKERASRKQRSNPETHQLPFL